jgi:hypothetical protein
MGNANILGILGFAAITLFATVMERMRISDFDPNMLPPPAAGLSSLDRGENYIGTVYAALLNGKLTFYELGQYDYMTRIDASELYPEITGKLGYSLLNCDGYLIPSAVRFASLSS